MERITPFMLARKSRQSMDTLLHYTGLCGDVFIFLLWCIKPYSLF